MSDHGDEFWEHRGLGHGTTLYRELLRVPLIVVPDKRRGLAGAVIDAPVRNIDIVPTLLDLLDIPIPARMHGTSLLTLINGEAPGRTAEFTLSGVVSIETADNLLCVTERGYKYIRNYTNGMEELYDLAGDPADSCNLADSLPAVASDLRDKLSAYRAALIRADGGGETARIDKKTMEKLKSLGYL
jgi:arylsulfatase A-like enzyme